MAETAEAVRVLGGAAVVPHPFQRTRHGVRRGRLRRVDPDAIETYNAWLFTGYRNRRARRYAARHGYPGVGGSDAHTLPTVGRAYTEITVDRPPADVGPSDVVAAIRAGDTAIRGQRAPVERAGGHYAKAAARRTVQGAFAAVERGGSGAARAASVASPFG